MTQNGQPRVPRDSRISSGPQEFDRCLLTLVPSRNRVAIRQLFNNRASWSAIKHWRKGRRRVPDWAREALSGQIARSASALQERQQSLAGLPRQMPADIAQLNRWRLQRALEKEKAPN